MFLVVITTILDSISDIIYKKALAITEIKPTVFQFFGELFSIPFIVGIMIFSFNFSLFLNPIIVGIFLLEIVLFIFRNNIDQYLYKNEKLATLLPYSKINNFITIIAGFLFFKDASWTSFLICMIAIILTTVVSIDLKNHEFPKNFGRILLSQAIRATELMLSVFVLKLLTSLEYALINQTFYICIAFLIICFTRELGEFKKFTKPIIAYRWGGYLLGLISWFIDLLLLKEFGIIITTLFGFFGSSLSLVLAYFFLKEVPEKKEIALGVVMIILAGVGYYFR